MLDFLLVITSPQAYYIIAGDGGWYLLYRADYPDEGSGHHVMTYSSRRRVDFSLVAYNCEELGVFYGGAEE